MVDRSSQGRRFVIRPSNRKLVPASTPHELSHIPHEHSFIPRASRTPAFGTKHAPVHAHCKFSVSVHSSNLSAKASATAAVILCRSIRPYSTAHVVACREESVAQMWTPAHFAYCVFVTLENVHRPRRYSEVKRPNHTINTSCCEN